MKIKVAMQYVVKLKTNALNLTHSSVFERQNEFMYGGKQNFISPLKF